MKKKAQWNSLLKCIASGMSITDAAIANRIDRITIYNKRDRDPEFAKDLEQALIATKIRAVDLIQKAMISQWQSAAWWLERRWPDEYAVKNKLEMQLTFQRSEKMKPIENEKLIEVVTTDEIENHAE